MPIVNLAREAAAQERWADKLRMWIAEPGWTPAGVQLPEDPSEGRTADTNAVPGLSAYILVHLMPVGTATAFVIAYSAIAPSNQLAVGSGYIFWTAMNWAGLLEERGWAVPSEWTRLVAVGIGNLFAPGHWLGACGVVRDQPAVVLPRTPVGPGARGPRARRWMHAALLLALSGAGHGAQQARRWA